MRKFLHIQPEVAQALANNEPVVALESTVITHGLPYPDNVATAVNMQTAVRDGGAVPATIAIIKGQVHVGLTDDQLEYLGQLAGKPVRKCSRRDIPLAIGNQENGATTVAGTMILAHLAGIHLFATGGIGGVHRGHPFDISADLLELGQTPVAVVSSGAKSILDLPATREVLETHGVPVIGYGTDELPAFFARSSGLSVDIRLDTPEAVARVLQAHQQTGLQNGLLITVPVPAADACDPDMVEAAIEQATQEADVQGIHGPASTPWLLRRVVELTNGRSLQANVALLRNNGFVAATIARALTALS
ncbi:MAG: pseudouridine-5'-phosphate glycosidase [Ardenticatenaceae bacterium]|nr:pseudouridine-5'-phosphate glycosidase [Anaerolineales bacterium]MCB8939540.1 pseudouridine-5'-phosphate glycosidase [Ardenticatenaceae bacterium]MCB8975037.1 pseudouridine-5'-phosphate glycosidase [Ardenticatenaceae bacterium]